MDTKKINSPTKPSNLIFIFLSLFSLLQCQLRPSSQGRVGHAPERVGASMTCKVEVRNVPEGGGSKHLQDSEGVTTSVAHNGYPTKSGYLSFDPGGMSTINLRPTWCQVSESIISHRGIQVKIPVRSQLSCHLYQSQSILSRYWLPHQDWESLS